MANEVKILLTVESNTVKIQEVSQEITKLGQNAEKAGEQGGKAGIQAASGLDGWAASAQNAGVQLLGVMGIVASVAGAAYLAERAFTSWYDLISGGISIVDDYQKKIISTSYILTTMSDIEPPDLSKSYAQWKDYFAWWYQQALDVDKRAAASALEINALGIELAKKGVVAQKETWQEDVDTIGRLTDLMKAVTPTYMNFEQQARGEVQALMEGTARMGAQTAQILSQIDPEFKKNILNARATGTELEYIRSILPQIKQYTLDLMSTWDAVGASLKSAWSVINLSAFGAAHREVVAQATQLSNLLVDNGELTETGAKAAQALGSAWESAKVSVAALMDYVLNNTDEVVDKVKKVATTVGTIASAGIKAAVAVAETIDWLDKMYDKANKATSANIPTAPQDQTLGQKAFVGWKEAFDPLNWMNVLLTTAKFLWDDIWENTERAGQSYMGLVNKTQMLSERIGKVARMIEDSSSLHWAIDTEGLKTDIAWIEGKVGWLIGIFSKAYTWTVNVALSGLPAWFGTDQQKPDPNEFQGYETAGEGLRKPMKTGPPPTPPVRPYTGKEPKGKGDDGAFAEASRLASLFDTLNKDIARLSEGKLSAIEADYIKTVDQIYKKTEVRAVSEAELEVLAKTRSTLQKAKLQDDFDLKMAKDSGDVFLAIQKDYEKDLSRFKGLAGEKGKLEANRAKKELDARQKFQEQIMGMESSSLSAMAAAAPLLSQQLPIEKALLDIELKRGDLKMEEELRILKINHMISAGQEEELRGLKALENQAKLYALERKGWMLEGVSGGLKAGALDRGKEAETPYSPMDHRRHEGGGDVDR